jgi:primosomal protein N' (replication factor Y)
MFSRLLQQEIASCLAHQEQIMLFLNRRGASTFVMCRDCGTVIRCPHCDVPLTFHLKGKQLNCHHCNHRQPVPTLCPVCQSRRIKHFGVGTQRVESAVQELWPTARTLRWDRDATRQKGSHQALLDRFTRHEADVLIGTQMIAKGLDMPLVTLVGVVTADTALNLPDFRAAERTFQILAQVSGRAGRGVRGGKVVVQTYTPEHYAIQAAAEHDYPAFYAQERAFRHQLGYPPFGRLARLVYAHSNPQRCREAAHALSTTIYQHIRHHHLDRLSVIGPAACFLSRLRGKWRWHLVLRTEVLTGAKQDSPGETQLHDLLRRLVLPPGWRLDVDPLDML